MPSRREVWIGLHGPPIGSFPLPRAVLNPQEIAEIEPRRRIVRIEVHDTPVEAFSRLEVVGLLSGLRPFAPHTQVFGVSDCRRCVRRRANASIATHAFEKHGSRENSDAMSSETERAQDKFFR